MRVEVRRWQFRDRAAARDARRAFGDFLRSHCAPDSDLYGSELIFGELAANGIEHGDGLVTLTLFREGRELIVTVHDEGGWISSQAQHDAPAPLESRGRGLYFVRTVGRRITEGSQHASISVVLPAAWADVC